MNPQRLSLAFALIFVVYSGTAAAQAPGKTTVLGKQPSAPHASTKKPTWADLRKGVEKYFAEQRGRQPTDILVSSEARATIELMAKAGWKPKESEKLLARVSGDGDFLVRELKTKEGRKFLAATSSEANVYDRLDKLTKHSGGDRLVSSVIRLPNGPSFMRPKPTPGFGTLMDLLPKGASGKTPIDPEFNKPTGKIYTSTAWIKELEAAYVEESKPAPATKKPGR